MRRVHSTCLRFLTHSCAHLPQNSSIEYHWIYRFVVQDESIRLMDESCGYIEQVDDDSVFGFVSGRDVRANLTTARKKEPRRRSMRQHGQRFGRRQTQRRDEFGLDGSIVTDDLFKKKSLLDEQDDEEDHSTMSVSAYAKSEKKEDFRNNSSFKKNNII